MIDSSTLLLTIVMTSPAYSLDAHNGQEYVSINTLDGIMQRLCWPHSTTLNTECDADPAPLVAHQEESEEGLIKAIKTLNTLRFRHY